MNAKIGKKLYARLTRYQRQGDRLVLGALVLIFLAVGILASLAAFLSFSAWFYLLLLMPVGLGVYYFLRRPSLYQLARKLEQEDETWQDRLSTAVDLSAKRNPKEVYSPELVGGYVEGIEARLEGQLLPLSKARKMLVGSSGILGAAVIIALIIGFLAPARLGFGLDAVFAPNRLDLRIEALATDTLVKPGDRIEVGARIQAPIKLNYVYLVTQQGGNRESKRVKITDGLASQRIKVEDEQKLYFQRLGRRSRETYIGLLQPFEIRQVEFTVFAPGYTGEKPRTSSGTRFSALPGSRVEIVGTASSELSEASLIIGDSLIDLATAEREFNGSFRFRGQDDLTLLLKNRSGARVEHRIEVISRTDESPLVEVFMPGKDTQINRFMTLTLGIHVLDDYGLGNARLVARGAAEQTLGLARGANRTEDTIFYSWDVSGFNLLPGDEITYYVEAADNDVVLGPKWGRSKTYRLRFPDLSEIFSEVTEYGEQTAGGLSELSEQQGHLSQELSRIEEKLRAEQTLSPEERERLQELIREQQNLLSSVDSLATQTKELLQQLEQGMITDPETLEKLSNISQMLAELMPPELKQKLSDLAQMLSENPQLLAQAMSKTGELGVDMQNQLNQAIQALERFLQEQRLAELAEKAEALARMEEELMREADNLEPGEAARRQREIEEGLKELSKEAAELANQLEDSEISEELREIAAQMAAENKELSQSVEESLSQGKMNRSEARKLSKNLRDTGKQLNMMLANLQKRRNQALEMEMAKLTRELLLLSEEQENLTARIGKEDNLELAARATELERAIERSKEDVFKLASQSLEVPRDAMHSLASASREAGQFKQSLIEGRRGTAEQHGRSTQHEIDRAASALLDAFAECSGQQCSSSSLEQLMQSLSAMSLAQLSINQQMGGLLPLPISAESMSASQRQALAELMAQQAALRQQLEEMMQAAGQEPGLSGMLEGIIEEMKALEEDMARYTGERELVERGEHVFRRLLDARNVLRKKQETREREREIGSVWEGLASPSLPQDAGERNLYLKKELLRFLQSDYPEEYKRLARAYLEALLEQE
jgi:hypothetical protein